MSWWSFKPYVSVAQRLANANREVERLKKHGRKILPVRLEGKAIARTFWGKAWCENLESYSDYENRLPRGRSYVRNGSVCDLQIEPGRVTALVCGSELYRITIAIKPVEPALWDQIRQECAGRIGSLIELLEGKLSEHVMEVITRPGRGLFPKPAEIELDCSCPDWAGVCKHVAAAMYGVGARVDERPELLFVLRQVDHMELIREAGDVGALTGGATGRKTIAADALTDVFGIELDAAAAEAQDSPKAGRAQKGARVSTPAGKTKSSKGGGKSPPGRPERRKATPSSSQSKPRRRPAPAVAEAPKKKTKKKKHSK